MIRTVAAACIAAFALASDLSAQDKFVRYSLGGRVAYGQLDGETVRELDRNFLDGGRPTGKTEIGRAHV